jgi:hypothetical protein
MKIKGNSPLPLIGLVIVIIIDEFLLNNVLALSSSFPRQEITDPPHDWKLLLANQPKTLIQTQFGNRELNFSNNEKECLSDHQYLHPPNIDGVTYVSNGRTLNATLWLSDVFKELPLTGNNMIRQLSSGEMPYTVLYGMSMDIHTPYDTTGTDYSLYLRRSVSSKSWNMTIIEHSPSGETRIADNSDIKNRYSSFFGNGTDEVTPWIKKGYVNLSFDLAKLNYPNQYDLFFYAQDNFIKNGRLCRLVDITQRIFVPPPEFVISTLPNSVELRPGEEKNIQVQVKANTSIASQVLLYTNNTKGITLNFNSNRTAIPSFGVATSYLNIKVPQNITPAPYTLPIFANISTPVEIKPRRSSITGEAITSSPQNLSKISFFTMTVNNPLTWDEQIKNFWDKLGSPITFIYGIIVVAVPWGLNEIRKKLKGKGKGKT